MDLFPGLTKPGFRPPALAGSQHPLFPGLSLGFPRLRPANMAAHEDVQKPSSMPSTPQSFLYYETDSPFPQSGNEELWHSSKRRRTQQRPSSETQFIHMNGYKSDSQLGTRFNNTYVDSYSDSKTFENTQNKSGDAASVPEESTGAAVETASKDSDDLLEVSSAKSVRSARKPMERSTETSQRVLKVKSGAGSSQPTNIQTFIFKTKLDPRNIGYRDRSDEPGTPSSVNETPEVQMENSPTEPSTRSTRKTRKSEVSNMLKFKSYTPNATPVLRGNNASRKTPRQEQSVDANSPAPTIADDQASLAAFEQERQPSPDKMSQYETPMKEDVMRGPGDINSAQRRSTRVRKPAKTVLLEELAKETPRKEKSTKEQGSTTAAQSSKSLSKSANTNVAEPASYASPPARQSDAGYPYGDVFDRYGTPSPDGLSNTRSSGRVRKPTIKAIEALQSKPHSRKRLRNSNQNIASSEATISQDKGTPEPANTANTSTVPTSRSASGGSSDAPSVSVDENDILGRQLYDLASTAIVDTASVEDEEAKIAEWREAFNKKRNEKISTPVVEEVVEAAEPEPEPEAPKETPPDIEYLNLPGEINTDVPLDHPQRPRPFTEEDGWMHTGRVNQHGEEYCVAPAEKYQWVKHASNYKTPIGPIPTPPPVLKSVDEIRRDNIYGFPPSPGTRNLYQKHPGQVWRFENLEGLVSKTPTHTKSLRSSDRSVAKQVDAMNVDESGMKTRYIHKKGFPRFKRPLKIVFVDSSKLDLPAPSESTASLRRRRQSAPLFAGANSSTPSKTAGSNQRKRSLDMTGGSHAERSKQAQPQRKKRQSAVKADDKSTPARPKRQSTVGTATNNNTKSGRPSTPATAPPKLTSSGAKATGGLEKLSLKFHFGNHNK